MMLMIQSRGIRVKEGKREGIEGRLLLSAADSAKEIGLFYPCRKFEGSFWGA